MNGQVLKRRWNREGNMMAKKGDVCVDLGVPLQWEGTKEKQGRAMVLKVLGNLALSIYDILGQNVEHGEMKQKLMAQGIHNLNREAST